MLKYPPSRIADHIDELHGEHIADRFRWLEEVNSSETQAWIDAQNAITEEFLARIPDRERIRARLTELWNYERYGSLALPTPVKRGGRYFVMRNDGLQDQSVLCWTPSLDGKLKPLLDPNELSDDGTIALGSCEVSGDGHLIAYALTDSGSDWLEWRVRDVDSGRDLEDRVHWGKFSGASWTKDSGGFFYSRYAEPQEGQSFKGANYYHKLYYHRIGTPQSEDELVYERINEREWGFDGRVSDDGHYLIITVWRGTNRENALFYRDLRDPQAEVVELLTGFDAEYTYVGNDGPRFYFRTNADAPLSQVIAIDVRKPERDAWEVVIPEETDALESISLIGDTFVACYLQDAHSRVATFDLTGRHLRDLPLPGIGAVMGFRGLRQDPETFYLYTSFTTPASIFSYNVATGETRQLWESKTPFEPKRYTTEQVFYKSKDGTRVPMFLSYKRGIDVKGATPTYLYGYGGFNAAMTPSFSVVYYLWMEMGGIYAHANLRGGGEYGKGWHDAGRRHQKQNVFDDFIAAAEWLIAEGYTSPAQLCIGGRSNGGLLVGACMTQRPELYGVCLVGVGVLDMLRFHRFTIGWAWVSDYGSPDDPEEFRTLLAYSPYHNLKPGTTYPATLIATGDHDDRVFPAHSFKFAAELQRVQAGEAPALIRIERKTGHGHGKPTALQIAEWTDHWAFVVKVLEMEF